MPKQSNAIKAKQRVLNFAGRIEGIASDSLSQEIKVLENSTRQLPKPD